MSRGTYLLTHPLRGVLSLLCFIMVQVSGVGKRRSSLFGVSQEIRPLTHCLETIDALSLTISLSMVSQVKFNQINQTILMGGRRLVIR